MLDLNRAIATQSTISSRDQASTDASFIEEVRKSMHAVDTEVLYIIDRKLFDKFVEQDLLFRDAILSRKPDQIAIHGEATLRGVAQCNLTISNALNAEKGCGANPGPPPSRLASGRYARTRTEKFELSQQSIFKKWYRLYLLSEAWEKKRHAVLKRCNGTCEGCHEANATQIHHITYDHVGSELLFELVGLCSTCHELVHAK